MTWGYGNLGINALAPLIIVDRIVAYVCGIGGSHGIETKMCFSPSSRWLVSLEHCVQVQLGQKLLCFALEAILLASFILSSFLNKRLRTDPRRIFCRVLRE